MVAVKGDVMAAKPRSGRSCRRWELVKDVYSSGLGAGASSHLDSAASLPNSVSSTRVGGEEVIFPDMTPSWCLGEAGRAKSGGVKLPTSGFRLAAIARHARAGKPPPSPHQTPEYKPAIPVRTSRTLVDHTFELLRYAQRCRPRGAT